MSTLTKRIRKHVKIRPGLLAICIIGLGALLIAPVFGEGEADKERQYILYDDISNTVRAAPETGPVPDTTPGDTTPGDTTPGDTTPGDTTPGDTTPGNTTPGDTTPGNADNGSGQDNNGHGNNEDGVDSSNPGQGQGGPNGQVDESCDGTGDCVDDEAGTGKGKGKK